MWSLLVSGCEEEGAPGESTPPPCPQSLASQMVVRKLNPNETLRLFEVDACDLENGALSFKLLFSLKPAIPLVIPRSKVPAIKVIPCCIPSQSLGTVVC